MRTLAPPVGRGWEYLTGDGTFDFDAELAELPELLRREARGARASRPARYDLVDRPLQPVADHPRVHRPRHRARPGAGLRGQLRRHLVRHPRPARAPCSTAPPVMHVTGDRTTPHGLATVGYDDEGVEAPVVGHRARRRPGRLPARPARWRTPTAPGSTAAAPTAAPTPTRPGTSRSSGWPTSRCSPTPTAPTSTGLISRRRARHLRRRRQVAGRSTCSATTSSSPASGSTRSRTAGSPGSSRDVAYQATTTDFWGSMEAVGGPQTYVLGGAFNCGKAQPGQVAAGQPRLPDRAVPRRAGSSTRPRRARHERPDRSPSTELVEHALATSTSDDCVVIVRDSTGANLRWANNTLTTNGVMHGVEVTVIAFQGARQRLGQRHRRLARPGRPPWSRRPTRPAAAADEPAEDRAELVRGRPRRPTGTTPPARPRSTSSSASPRRSARPSGRPRPSEPRSSTASSATRSTTTYLGSSHRPAAAARAADRPLRAAPARTPRSPTAPGSAAPPATSATSTRPGWPPTSPRASPGASAASTCPPGATTRCCRRARSPT